MIKPLLVLLALYLLVGVGLVVVGRLRKLVLDGHRQIALTAAIAAETGGSVGRARFYTPLFLGLVAIAAVVLWPFGLSHLRMEAKERERRRLRANAAREAARVNPRPLRFSGMGGAGSICCRTCGFEERIISFTHGVDTCNAGYQCATCGQFVQLRDEHRDCPERRCACGGELHRDRDLFCPKCRNLKLDYRMHYIT